MVLYINTFEMMSKNFRLFNFNRYLSPVHYDSFKDIMSASGGGGGEGPDILFPI